jgi:hypothetical protein
MVPRAGGRLSEGRRTSSRTPHPGATDPPPHRPGPISPALGMPTPKLRRAGGQGRGPRHDLRRGGPRQAPQAGGHRPAPAKARPLWPHPAAHGRPPQRTASQRTDRRTGPRPSPRAMGRSPEPSQAKPRFGQDKRPNRSSIRPVRLSEGFGRRTEQVPQPKIHDSDSAMNSKNSCPISVSKYS